MITMNTNTRSVVVLVIGFIAMLPTSTFASTSAAIVLRQQPAAHVGDVVRIPVDLSVSGEVGVNALSAQLVIQGPATLEAAETGNSVFNLWPEFNIKDAHTLQFVGGTPSSVGGSDLHLLTLVLRTTGAGHVSVMNTGAIAYVGDGGGTQVTVPDTRVAFSVAVSTSSAVVDAESQARVSDTTLPDPFDVTISRDVSVFGGKYFITFHTSDQGTGVQRYEVKEGAATPIVASSPYVLTDQTERPQIEVRAYDYAGNVRTAYFGEPTYTLVHALLVLIAFLLLAALVFMWRWIRKQGMRP